VKKTHDGHRRLLRACRQRPRNRRADESNDELSPPRMIESHLPPPVGESALHPTKIANRCQSS
jgi:hypothetical protein